MSDSIRDRLKATDAEAEAHSDHPVGDPVVSTHHSYNGHLRDDPAQAKRAERMVASLFMLSVVGVIGFVVSFIAAPFDFGKSGFEYYTPLLGFFMTLALVGVGAGAVLWAKTLMIDEETVQERHDLRSTDQERAETAELLKQGLQDSGLPRRSLLLNSLLLGSGALAVLPVPFVFGFARFQHKERTLGKTGWKAGSKLLDELGRPVKMGDLEVGGAKSVFPDVPGGRRMADSVVWRS